MLRIRLQRKGRRNQPAYRVVVAERSAPPKGRFVDIVGYLDPITDERGVDAEKVKAWIAKGAKPTPTVHNMLVDLGVIEGPKVRAWRPKKKDTLSSATADDSGAETDEQGNEENASVAEEGAAEERQGETDADANEEEEEDTKDENGEPTEDPVEEQGDEDESTKDDAATEEENDTENSDG